MATNPGIAPDFAAFNAAGDIEKSSPTWQAVKHFAEDRLQTARALNETVGLDEATTIHLRAEIAIMIALIALPEGKPDLNLGGNTGYNDSR